VGPTCKRFVCARDIFVFSQPLNWDLIADVTAGPWKGRKTKTESDKEVSVFQGHRRKRDLFEGLAGNFPYIYYAVEQLSGFDDTI